jgi:hypothetical protein
MLRKSREEQISIETPILRTSCFRSSRSAPRAQMNVALCHSSNAREQDFMRFVPLFPNAEHAFQS